ncbi:hypothetical protein [Actinomadura montaniterrae]|uniref:hypothetical protein n=1 Tax=Actinomadura montaniterrae TaxID=1803903 RepID=UPI00178C19D4|nr:hypothetical protein [Actinomadura montaniterrae]
MTTPSRRLLILPSSFLVDHLTDRMTHVDSSWYAVVRAPEGLTVIRRTPADSRQEDER